MEQIGELIFGDAEATTDGGPSPLQLLVLDELAKVVGAGARSFVGRVFDGAQLKWGERTRQLYPVSFAKQ